jgi:hypothetical protein
MATCRSCGAAIWWATTEAGKSIPIDPNPDKENPEGANVKFVAATTGDPGIRRAVVLGPDDARRFTGALYVSHFVTCSQADEWRTR